jgi:nucleoside-diphosphate-sugar epimerase
MKYFSNTSWLFGEKLLQRGDEVVGLDNINDYYDVNLKYARLNELGIDCHTSFAVTNDSHCEERSNPSFIQSSTNPNQTFLVNSKSLTPSSWIK